MFGAPADRFLGIRIPKELEEKLDRAAISVNKHEIRWRYGRLNKSSIAKKILEAFFDGSTDFKKLLDKAAGRKNVKQKDRRIVKQSGSTKK